MDHGKSTLVHALSGIDPDRLKEEKEREMTIDLGFAWLTLPSGERVGIVDVPGHKDFIKNMLSGVGGIDAALFVVAADEGVMPQTREHLAILDLLQVRGGVVALTKTDMAEDEDWLDLVEADLLDVLEGTVLDGAPVVRCSARKREGLEELLSEGLRNNPRVSIAKYESRKDKRGLQADEGETPFPVSPRIGPYEVDNVNFGAKNYYWCSCGMSKKQPFCDSSHQGTLFKPIKFSLD